MINYTWDNNNQINMTNVIENEVNRITTQYKKEFLDCNDVMKITGIGRDNIRKLFKSKNFPINKFGTRQVISVLNFVIYFLNNTNSKEANDD